MKEWSPLKRRWVFAGIMVVLVFILATAITLANLFISLAAAWATLIIGGILVLVALVIAFYGLRVWDEEEKPK